LSEKILNSEFFSCKIGLLDGNGTPNPKVECIGEYPIVCHFTPQVTFLCGVHSIEANFGNDNLSNTTSKSGPEEGNGRSRKSTKYKFKNCEFPCQSQRMRMIRAKLV
jgi:hypothetical protein